MELIIATNNVHKLLELKTILNPFFDKILSLNEAGITHETIEDGKTFFENAHKKAYEIAALSGMSVLADDSGLEVDALSGAPGVYSARYAGEKATDQQNVKLLLKNLRDVPMARRTARFVCVLSLIKPDHELSAFGETKGLITFKPSGSNGFGYDPVFYIPEYSKTFAQMDAQIKNKISHRAKAIEALVMKIKETV